MPLPPNRVRYGFIARKLIENFHLDDLISFEELESKRRKDEIYQINTFDILKKIKEEYSDLLKLPIFQSEELKKALIKGLRDDTINELYEIFKKSKNWDEQSPTQGEIQYVTRLQTKLDELIPIFYMISELFTDTEKLDLYGTLINLGLGHLDIEYRNYTLMLMFNKKFEEINYPQFDLDNLFNFLPSSEIINEIFAKHWEDSHIDPCHYIFSVAYIINKHGTKEQIGRFESWFNSLSDKIEEEHYKILKEMSFEQDENTIRIRFEL